MGFPTQRSKLLLSYIELYPSQYNTSLKEQHIQPIQGKTWEESEKSWIQKARHIIYHNDRYPQDILAIKTQNKNIHSQKQNHGFGYS
ncbi:MAG: hypothetical protein OXC92_07370 [Flavobacteriaceae bacterium]|nr:hypothetical protein [Flavobacteriaceae bacterium]MCY4216782.1 hypothetical protein [Flavobacteriaceae bacterium]MCY4253974.1 hypothetical protein [Flavobacteriaceae bacterium]